MRKQYWPKRDPIKNYFPLPNEIFSLGLSAGAIAVYGFLLHREDRKTYPVSYTHLDVYKRQEQWIFPLDSRPAAPCSHARTFSSPPSWRRIVSLR